MKTIYIADDGTQFDTAEECREYESTPTKKLAAFLHENREEFEIYCDDAGFNIPDLDHIAAFLIENKNTVIDMLTNQDDDGWVENTQTCNSCPVRSDDWIEVCFNSSPDAVHKLCWPCELDPNFWNTNYIRHIVKYRIVK